jgi:sugar lactone lactonase YvrE
LWVADTLNHSVKVVSLASGEVEVVAGTGSLAVDPADLAGDALRSPWDVAVAGGRLHVAMAGTHQVWRTDANGRLRPWAGSGREGLRDGPVAEAWLAQPSGLAVADDVLFVADSEVSAVRRLDLSAEKLETLVGVDLFEFGDVDGVGDVVRLQHPLGVASGGGAVWIADSYNGKVKRLDPDTRAVATVAEGFAEPGGLAWLDGRLYVADTNAHAIRTVDPATGAVTALELG